MLCTHNDKMMSEKRQEDINGLRLTSRCETPEHNEAGSSVSERGRTDEQELN